jgi:hypothetical protein
MISRTFEINKKIAVKLGALLSAEYRASIGTVEVGLSTKKVYFIELRQLLFKLKISGC